MIFGQYSSRNQGAKGLNEKHAFKIALLLAFCVWLIYKTGNSKENRKTYVESGRNNPNDDFGRKMKFELIKGMRDKSDDRNTDLSIGAENDELSTNTNEKDRAHMDKEHREVQRIVRHPGMFVSEHSTLHEESQNNEENGIYVGNEDSITVEEMQKEGEGSSDSKTNDAEEDAKESEVGEHDKLTHEGEKEFHSEAESREEREREEASLQQKELRSNETDNSGDSSEQETPIDNGGQDNDVDFPDVIIATAEGVQRKRENEQVEAKNSLEEISGVKILNVEGQNELETIDEKVEKWEEDKSESDKRKDVGKYASEERQMRRMEEEWSDTDEMESQANSTMGDITVNDQFSEYGTDHLRLNEAAGEHE